MRPSPLQAAIALPLLIGTALFGYVHHAHTLQMARLSLLAKERGLSDVLSPPVQESWPRTLDSQVLDAMSTRVAEVVVARLQERQDVQVEGSLANTEASQPTPLSGKQEEALHSAHRIVDQAVRAGQLTQEAAMELRRLHAEVGPNPEYRDVVQKIIVAINLGKLTPPSPNAALWMP